MPPPCRTLPHHTLPHLQHSTACQLDALRSEGVLCLAAALGCHTPVCSCMSLTHTSLCPCRPSTAASQPPAAVAALPAASKLSPAFFGKPPAELRQPSRGELAERSLTGTSSLVFPPSQPAAAPAAALASPQHPLPPPSPFLSQQAPSNSPRQAGLPRSLTSAPGALPSPRAGTQPLARRATVHAGAGLDGGGAWPLSPPSWLPRQPSLPAVAPVLEGGGSGGRDGSAMQPVSRQGSFSARRRTSR